jgi:putative ABC transport system permease protein
MLFKLAVRNVFRNKRRTLITVLVIVVGMVSMIFLNAVLTRMSKGWGDALVNSNSGHLSVIRSDYLDNQKSRPQEMLLRQVQAYYTALDHQPEVEACMGKLEIGGLIAAGSRTTTFFGYGLDLERQARALPKAFGNVKVGKGLQAGDPEGAILGTGLAKSLDRKIGDTLLLAVKNADGRFNTASIVIRGLIKSSEGRLDDNLVLMPLAAAQSLLNVPECASEIIVRLKPGADLETSQRRLLTKVQPLHEKIVIKTWVEMNAMFEQVRGMFDGIAFTVALILFITVGASIANTMLMSVFERVREIGTMRALGTKPRQVTQMFLLEGLVIGVIGALLGLVLGFAITQTADWVGIPMRIPGSKEPYMVHPIILYGNLLAATGVVLAMSLLASVLPAHYAAQLKPVEALQKN